MSSLNAGPRLRGEKLRQGSRVSVLFALLCLYSPLLFSDPESVDPFLQKTCEIIERINGLDMFEIDADSAVAAFDLQDLIVPKQSEFPEITEICTLLEPFGTIRRKVSKTLIKGLVEKLYDLSQKLTSENCQGKILILIQDFFYYLHKESARQLEIKIQERKRTEAIEATDAAFNRGAEEGHRTLGIDRASGEDTARREEERPRGRDTRYPRHPRRARAR